MDGATSMPDYRAQFAQALQNQMANKDPAMAQLESELQKPVEQNSHRPIISLIDNLTGSKFAQQLPKQESAKDRLAQLLQLRQGQQSQYLGGLGKLAQMQGSAEDKAAQRAFQQKMYDLQLAKIGAKANAPEKLGADVKAKLGYTTTLLKELPKLRALYEQDSGTIRPGVAQLFGQNNAEQVANALAENYGRLQSGGAINKDEESRFLGRLGSMMDSKDIKLAKLKQIEEEIADKHNIYGGAPISSMDMGRGPSNQPKGVPQGFDPMTASEEELDLFKAQNPGLFK